MARFIPNRNFERDLERDIAYVGGLKEKAEDAADASKQIARAEAYDQGDYHDSIRVTVDGKDVYVSAYDFKARWIELGSVNNSPKAPLRRGAQSAGLKFRASK